MNSCLQVPPAPPLIQAKRVPPWLLFRDLLLTVVAWIAIIQSMRYGLYLLYDYLTPPMFEVTHAKVPRLLEMWTPLKGFVLDALVLVIWLAFWAFYGTRRFRTKPATPQPAPLPITEHANYLGVKPNELARWRTYCVAVVEFDVDNRIIAVSRRDLASTVATATG